jgi:hypothetical protein
MAGQSHTLSWSKRKELYSSCGKCALDVDWMWLYEVHVRLVCRHLEYTDALTTGSSQVPPEVRPPREHEQTAVCATCRGVICDVTPIGLEEDAHCCWLSARNGRWLMSIQPFWRFGFQVVAREQFLQDLCDLKSVHTWFSKHAHGYLLLIRTPLSRLAAPVRALTVIGHFHAAVPPNKSSSMTDTIPIENGQQVGILVTSLISILIVIVAVGLRLVAKWIANRIDYSDYCILAASVGQMSTGK